MHYQAGPVIYRQFQWGGMAWLAVFEAEHDGHGWLVMRTWRRPMVLMPGDTAHFRAPIIEDRGPMVLSRFSDSRGTIERELPRSSIVFLEEGEPRPVS